MGLRVRANIFLQKYAFLEMTSLSGQIIDAATNPLQHL